MMTMATCMYRASKTGSIGAVSASHGTSRAAGGSGKFPESRQSVNHHWFWKDSILIKVNDPRSILRTTIGRGVRGRDHGKAIQCSHCIDAVCRARHAVEACLGGDPLGHRSTRNPGQRRGGECEMQDSL